jgi:hypothetical protein
MAEPTDIERASVVVVCGRDLSSGRSTRLAGFRAYEIATLDGLVDSTPGPTHEKDALRVVGFPTQTRGGKRLAISRAPRARLFRDSVRMVRSPLSFLLQDTVPVLGAPFPVGLCDARTTVCAVLPFTRRAYDIELIDSFCLAAAGATPGRGRKILRHRVSPILGVMPRGVASTAGVSYVDFTVRLP